MSSSDMDSADGTRPGPRGDSANGDAREANGDRPAPDAGDVSTAGGSRVVKARDFRWEDVGLREYKPGDEDHFADITRQTLLSPDQGQEALSFETRYFEVQPGGYSSLERHRHPHAVVVVRGRGTVVLGDAVREIAPFDCVYVAPGDVHRFRATGEEPLGFLCVVDRDRDRPEVVPESEDPSAPD